MGVYEMLKYHAPPILILLHLHLVNNVNLRADEASASALFVCFFPAPRHALSGHLFLQAYDWVEFFSGEGKVSAETGLCLRFVLVRSIFTRIRAVKPRLDTVELS